MDGKKYYFVYNQDNSGELTLYDESMQKNLLTCSFNSISQRLSNKITFIRRQVRQLKLLVLCWYAFQPHTASGASSIVKQPDLILP